MKTETQKTICRKDYRPPVFQVERIEMGIDLDPSATVVAARLHLNRQNPGALELDGESLELLQLSVDGRTLSPRAYGLAAIGDKQTLTIADLPERCVLDIAVRISPYANTSLMGLYLSGGNFVTQCEAEGFRKITFFPDRPDIMARYTVMLRADRSRYPVLLSNGNLVESGRLPDGRHYAKWEDPFPKPSYLFALVAGKLAHIERRVTTRSGRSVLLQVYTDQHDLPKAGHALDSLERSLKWDEARFGLELDLDRFMIVAVGDFNMGAMENKGLNIFNTKFVLADPRTETDADFANIEGVVGHEYFHNWTGNRVTCRDWFQLTLKEGLTVFRDQEFSADMAVAQLNGDPGADAGGVRAALRIENVRNLRATQFPEDAGPMAHPVRPESYQEIGNFYTATVYQKGSEVIRMQQTLLGRDGFRAGMDEYFRRHDGQAVSCDDFVSAMESIYVVQRPGKKLDRFRRWYSQAGTPRVSASTAYDGATKKLTLTLRQICPKVGVEKAIAIAKQPFHIPFAIGLVDRDGRSIPLALEGESAKQEARTTRVLDLVDDEQRFVFVDVASDAVPSLLRDFSAPVIVEYPYSDADLALLLAHDADPFNRWEAGQRLATRELIRLTHDAKAGRTLSIGDALIDAFRTTLRDTRLDPGLKEAAITLPGEGVIGEQLPIYDPAAVRRARLFLIDALAAMLADDWHAVYASHRTVGRYSPAAGQAASRALKNCALGYLARLDDADAQTLVDRQWASADNMTDRLAAFLAIVNAPSDLGGGRGAGSASRRTSRRTRAVDAFYRQFHRDPLVVDKWLRVQSTTIEADDAVLDTVAALTHHAAYAAANPNKVYALLGGFFSGNPAAFHRADGRGHAFWAEQILLLDAINPTVAGRLARTLERWQKLTPDLQASAKAALLRVRNAKRLSRDVAEILDKALAA